MMKKVIKINEDKCIGCGLCANACHQGAIGIVDGKAKLMREDYCDGLGNCLPVCPTDAISFEEKDIDIKEAKEQNKERLHSGCKGSAERVLNHDTNHRDERSENKNVSSELRQWPVQIKLISPMSPSLDGCDLLIAADCTAFAYGNIHNDFIKNRTTLIGCPKLDEGDYSLKLQEIIENNDIKSLTVLRMEVPCCSGIATAAEKALTSSKKEIPFDVITVTVDGGIAHSNANISK